MIITPVKTIKVTPGMMTLAELVGTSIPRLKENSILVITSKIVSLCENRVEDMAATDKEDLVKQESDRYTNAIGQYGFHFTITKNTLIPSAGIDESNSDNHYVLWPRDSQKSANEIRKYLKERYKLRHIGVIITDSTCTPLRRGTTGIALAHSGFSALHNYIGQPDLFGRTLKVSQSNIAGGLAAGAVTVMGEGREQTPLCIIEDINFVAFQDHDPSPAELQELRIEPEEDIFAPFFSGVEWNKGLGGNDHER